MKNLTVQAKLHWIFRVAVAAEFIGHGAFGIMTKPQWVPYFGVAGIGESGAYKLMPIVGAVDIILGVITLLSPRRAILLYMSVWGLWTAMLRPLSGEPIWEAVERAANYGIPLAFLLLSGWDKSIKSWLSQIEVQPLRGRTTDELALVLRLTTGLLFVGHGCLAALMHKDALVHQVIAIGLGSLPLSPESFVQLLGWFEVMLGILVMLRPRPYLLLFLAVWKVSTEALYPITGSPVWEFMERGGSYAAPLALFVLETWRASRVSGQQLCLRSLKAQVRPLHCS